MSALSKLSADHNCKTTQENPMYRTSAITKAALIGICAAAIATTAGCQQSEPSAAATPPPAANNDAITAPSATPAPPSASDYLPAGRVTSDNSALQIAATADEASISGNDLEKLESGMWKLTGQDPFLVFPLQSAVDGSVNTKLGFLFLCDDAAAKHVVQIFWQPEDGRISQGNSIRLHVNPGPVLVDLSGLPNWTGTSAIGTVRLDLATQSCSAVDFRNVSLGS
jgi:hypothetical protein